MVATTRPQLDRLHAWVAKRREWGSGTDDLRLLEPPELASRVRVAGALGAAFSPHCARVDPARLVRGLAEAVERRGVTIYERTPATAIEPGAVTTTHGVVRARRIVQATEAFTVELPGQRRRYLPLYSLMVATEPLPADVWEQIGWSGGETIADLRHLFFYAQRTPDDRLAIGGRGAPYRLGSPVDEANERNDSVRARLEATIRRHFPAAAAARITHHWGGALAVPRDWTQGCAYDPRTGLAAGGGYSGHGVLAAHLTGRTLADLLLERRTALVQMPWVGHRSPRWEPEPLRFVASRLIVAVMGSADRAEEHGSRTARRMRLIAPFVSGR
jgi:glycine/D-amino acid oxidase-like deaminating enzyme